MKVTTEILAPYKGGELEIQNQGEGYIFRGEVETIVVEDNEIRVRFAWLAKGKGFPPAGWVKDDELDYVANLSIYAVSDIGPGRVGGTRLSFNSPVTGELMVLFPPDGSKMDRSRIEGL